MIAGTILPIVLQGVSNMQSAKKSLVEILSHVVITPTSLWNEHLIVQNFRPNPLLTFNLLNGVLDMLMDK